MRTIYNQKGMKIRISILLIILILKIYHCLSKILIKNECDRTGRPKICPRYLNPVCAWYFECVYPPCNFNAPNPCEACKNRSVQYTTPGKCPSSGRQ